ncbi:hypothetical protein ACCO45_001346 [Purpureocillium lilacinum]|uniref:Uncharacterized protein n=1 Tax=Purpureocillium lilacinum TaxID=33203 RepID=A0ACC4E6T7_PURLI
MQQSGVARPDRDAPRAPGGPAPSRMLHHRPWKNLASALFVDPAGMAPVALLAHSPPLSRPFSCRPDRGGWSDVGPRRDRLKLSIESRHLDVVASAPIDALAALLHHAAPPPRRPLLGRRPAPGRPRRDGLVARNTPASPAPTQTQSAQGQGQGQGPVQPAAVTPSVSLPVACDYTYCDGSSSWCFYWGGVTSYDPNHGPVPGETRTNLGPCGAAATTAPAATR